MNRKPAITGVLVAGLLASAPVGQASAHEFYHHGHGGGPVFGLVRAAVDIATLPVRVVGGVATAVTYYPTPVARPYYAQPVYYAAPPVYAYPPQYAYPQPVYAYPQGYGQ